MSLTQTEARDAVIGIVRTAWKASGAATEGVALFYEGVSYDSPGEGSVESLPSSYGRVTVRTLASGQATLGPNKRFDSEGTVRVQIFTPTGDGWAKADVFCRVVLNALRGYLGTSSTLWFFDETPSEVGVEGPWLRMDVVAGFRYQEVIDA